VALIGSYVRDEADAFSDVGLVCFVHQYPERESEV
jgi:predicted nucleotidyltransferase